MRCWTLRVWANASADPRVARMIVVSRSVEAMKYRGGSRWLCEIGTGQFGLGRDAEVVFHKGVQPLSSLSGEDLLNVLHCLATDHAGNVGEEEVSTVAERHDLVFLTFINGFPGDQAVFNPRGGARLKILNQFFSPFDKIDVLVKVVTDQLKAFLGKLVAQAKMTVNAEGVFKDDLRVLERLLNEVKGSIIEQRLAACRALLEWTLICKRLKRIGDRDVFFDWS